MLLRSWFFLLCFVGCIVAAHRAEPCRHLAVPDPLLPLPTTTQSEKGNFLANHHSLLTRLHTAHCTLHTAHCTLHTAHCTLHTAHYARLLPLQPPHERLFSHQTPVSAHGLMIPTLFAPSSRTWILTYQANLGPRRPVRPVTLSLVQPLPALAAHALFLRLPSIMIFRGGPQGPSKPPPTTYPVITCPCCLSAITITLLYYYQTALM
jgi:hypothetical protein